MSDVVEKWLRQLGLGDYTRVFAENAIDEQVLPDLTDADLEKLGVKLGHRKKLLRAIAALAAPDPLQSPTRRPFGATSAESGDAERRQLTVMFCDLIGSTALSERLDLEEYRDVLAAYQTEATRSVKRYDGYIARYLGDGLLVYFGYPQAHEDDAERAVRAGLGIVEAVRGLKPHRHGELQVRIGIATGRVVAGDIVGEGASEERAVVGDTPNLAARLQSLADPGTVLIAASTRRLTGRLFTYEDRGLHELKGFAEPVSAWRVVSEAASESRFAATRSPEGSRLIGRETEVLLLLDRWERAKDAEGQVVLLSGEPGIGKSRLVHALVERIGSGLEFVLRYQCSPHHTSSAFHPFIEHIQRAAGFALNDTSGSKLAKLESWLGEAYGGVGEAGPLLAALLSLATTDRYPPLHLSPQHQKERTIKVLTERFSTLALRGPSLVIFEDAHWADPTTLDVLGIVIDAAASRALLIVITYRPELVPPWQGRGHITAHSLARLGKRQVVGIIKAVGGAKSLPDAVLLEIVAKADGVPLFVEELTKAVLETGLQERVGAARYGLERPLQPLTVPSTLKDSLVARLDRLGSVKSVAQLASAIGREFSYELLAAVSRLDERALEDALVQLEQSELIYRRGTPPHSAYSFKHALVRDAAYGSLLKRRREQLHAQLATALEARFPETASEEPELLAHHYTAAGRASEALDYRQRAAQRALERSAYRETLAHLDLALGLLETVPDMPRRRQRELEVQVARGGALMATQGYLAPATRDAFERARALSHEADDPRQSFRVLRGLHSIHFVRADLDTALEVAEECFRIAARGTERQPLSLAHRLVGQTLCMRGSLTSAREHLEQAVSLDSGSRSGEVAALIHGGGHRLVAPAFMAQVLWLQGFPDQALTFARAGLQEAEQQYGAFAVTTSMFFLCWIHGLRGEHRTLQGLAEEQRRLASEHDISEWVSPEELLTDWARIALGTSAEGMALASERLEGVRALARLRTPFKLGLLAGAIAAGGGEEALAVIDEALSLTERTGERWSQAELMRIKGEVLLGDGGRSPAAEICFDRSLQIAREQGARSWELRAATSLARVWLDRGKHRVAYELLAPVYDGFTEGFDTSDLMAAKALLSQVA